MFKFDSTLNRIRSVGIFEAISFILLLGVAMPMKRIFHMESGDMAVSIVGMAHGVLFILYIGLVGLGQLDYKWPKKTTILLLISSVLPLGPIIADAKLLKDIDAK